MLINFNSQPKIPEKITKMRIEYKNSGIPTILDDSLNLLLLTLQIKKPKKILEIGTATGMSGISMLYTCPDAVLTTLEKDEESYFEAKKNFKESKIDDKITQYLGDAGEILNFLDGEFDFIFLDGPKARYIDYLPDIIRLLSKGGVLFADNVLFRGYIDGSKECPKSDRTILRNLRKFINTLTENNDFVTNVLNVGDGILISYKLWKNLNF